jgi:hypothetical protein
MFKTIQCSYPFLFQYCTEGFWLGCFGYSVSYNEKNQKVNERHYIILTYSAN